MKGVKLLLALAVTCLLISSAFIVSSNKGAPNDKSAMPCSMTDGPRIPVALQVDSVSSSQPPVAAFGAGRGLAFGSNCFYPVRIQLAKVRSQRPLHIRQLLRENRSIEEVIEEITKKEVFIHQGHMRLADEDYKLVEINVTLEGDDYILDADVMELGPCIFPMRDGIIAGHIWINSTAQDGTILYDGKLEIHRGQKMGNYTLLLEMTSAAKSVMRCPIGPPPMRAHPI